LNRGSNQRIKDLATRYTYQATGRLPIPAQQAAEKLSRRGVVKGLREVPQVFLLSSRGARATRDLQFLSPLKLQIPRSARDDNKEGSEMMAARLEDVPFQNEDADLRLFQLPES